MSAPAMGDSLAEHMKDLNRENVKGMHRDNAGDDWDKFVGKDWTMHLGDCVDAVGKMDSDSIKFVQIAVAADPDEGDNLYALDEHGRVWGYFRHYVQSKGKASSAWTAWHWCPIDKISRTCPLYLDAERKVKEAAE